MAIHDGAPAGLYVHVPFCRGKCPYCDFASATDLALIPDWLAALSQEMQIYGDFASQFDTLYLGGGTPSLLAAQDLATLMENLQQTFPFSSDTEITIEANPDDLTLKKLQGYREMGINRLSLGVQSFDTGDLQFLGRRHDASQALQAIHWAREAGFPNLGLDLIYGLPGQTLEAWRRNLESALQCWPEHLSCYQLTVAEGTPFFLWMAEGRFSLPSEEEEREFFFFTSQFLAEQGYCHYEISNFARGAANRARHNRKYWNHTPYLGLGPAAHSYRDGRRWWNHRSIQEYCHALNAGQTPVAGEELLTSEQLRLEALCLGLRTTDGVELSLVREGLQSAGLLQEAAATGLVAVEKDRVIPTREGLVVADRLALWLTE
jgi:oxygen-independent coproporphyrinogen-3 oxidase